MVFFDQCRAVYRAERLRVHGLDEKAAQARGALGAEAPRRAEKRPTRRCYTAVVPALLSESARSF
jgi:hypothetical protein